MTKLEIMKPPSTLLGIIVKGQQTQTRTSCVEVSRIAWMTAIDDSQRRLDWENCAELYVHPFSSEQFFQNAHFQLLHQFSFHFHPKTESP